jgi:hypothetical protein
MKLITPEFEDLIKDYPLYSQGDDDPLVVTKLFDPWSPFTWGVMGYNPNTKIAEVYARGVYCNECGCGCVSLCELVNLIRMLTNWR